MDDTLWNHVTGAQSKRPALQGDQPTQQSMRGGIKSGQQKAPSADQKKVRRQMSKSASRPESVSDHEANDGGWGTTQYHDLCETCEWPISKKDGVWVHDEKNPVEWTDKRKATKESSMSTNVTEADLLQALASAPTMTEQREAADRLEQFRADRRDQIAREGDLDWSAMTAADLGPRFIVEQTTASGRVTADSDWLGEMVPDEHDATQVTHAMRAEATLWHEGLWSLVKQDPEEFTIQAHNAAQRFAAQYGNQRVAAASAFVETAVRLQRQAGFQVAAYYKEGEQAECWKGDGPIQFFDGAWMHLKQPGSSGVSSHNDVHPPNKSEQEALDAKKQAVTVGPDAFAGGTEKTQEGPYPIPQGSELPNPTDKTTFDGLVNGENGATADPKTDAADTPSLAEGDQPESDQTADGVTPPITDEQAGSATNKDTSAPSTFVDALPTGGKGSATGAKKTAGIALTNVGIYDKAARQGRGTKADGSTVIFQMSQQEMDDLKAVLFSDLAINFSGVTIEESDIVRMSAKSASAQSLSFFARVRQTLAVEDPKTDANGTPSLAEGDQPEGDASQSPIQETPAGDLDKSTWETAGQDYLNTGGTGNAVTGPTPSGTPTTNGGTVTGSALRGIGASIARHATSENTRTFGAALSRMSSLGDVVAGFEGIEVAKMVLASGDVIEPDRVRLEYLAGVWEADKTCGQCGGKIERDPAGEKNRSWHHADGSSHDHEAELGGDYEDSSRAASKKAGIDHLTGHSWSEPDSNGKVHCTNCGWVVDPNSYTPNRPCETHHESKAAVPPFVREGEYSRNPQGNPDLGWIDPKKVSPDEREKMRLFPDGIPLHGDLTDEQQAWLKRRSSLGVTAARVTDNGDGSSSFECGDCGSTVTRYRGEYDVSCPNCNAQYNASGQRLRDDWASNSSNWDDDVDDMEGYERSFHDSSLHQAAPRGNSFSISDAKNEEGEWIMSPEEIRAEMAYDPSEDDYDNQYEGSKRPVDPSLRTLAERVTASESVEVMHLPDCDICAHDLGKKGVPAAYDGATVFGPWANMCEEHFGTHGVGLGTGRGQRLILKTKASEHPVQSAADIPGTVEHMINHFTSGKTAQTREVKTNKCATCGGKILGVNDEWVHDVREPTPNHPDGSVAADAHRARPLTEDHGAETITRSSERTAERHSDGTGAFKVQVAGVGEDVWSQNSVTWDTVEEATAAAKSLASSWMGMDMARVVPSSTPRGEAVDPDDPAIVVNYR